MDDHTLKVLEFEKIKKMLSDRCLSDPAKELVFSFYPSTDLVEIEDKLKEDSELKEILSYEETFPLNRFEDIRNSLKKAKLEGAFLEPKELLSISEIISLSKSLLKFIKGKEKKYPKIYELISNLKSFDQIAKEISIAVDPSGEIKDTASKKLFSIRQEKKTLRNRLLDKLHNILGTRKAKGPRQDDVITIRDGRYVIPLSEAEFRVQKGIVHDQSSSGATLFVEPLVTVELNNNLRELELSEKREIERILTQITSLIRQEIDDLEICMNTLQKLDFIYAKAKLSLDLKCTKPILNQKGYIRLLNARHPLLATQKEVVPLSLELGKDFYTLVVTGPNTGGKTVALKTVGLLCLMALSGLHIPADEGSEIGLFQKLYADIGDEQSIETSLSTFSSHISQIIKAIKNSDENSLVLLDELGAGTDPKEGAALGEAIIESLTRKKVRSVITTHQGALKVLAENYPGIEDASLEFDKKSLKPTYRFQIGFPGSSYAVEIAQRLGMPEDIVKKAFDLVGSKERDLAVLIEKVQNNLETLRENRAKLNEQRKASEELLNLYQDRLKKLDEGKKEYKAKALKEAQKLVEDARKEIERLVAEIRRTQAEKEAIKQAHKYLEEKREEIIKKIEEQKIERKIIEKKWDIKVGDFVWIDSLNIEGEVMAQPDKAGKVKVRIGNIISSVPKEELSLLEGEPKKELSSGIKYQLPSLDEIRPEIDLRGMTSDEAIDKVDKYLYDAYLAGLTTVEIIHGKGTGALRKKMQEFLKEHPKVESYRLGELNEGGSGVTIVKLKE